MLDHKGFFCQEEEGHGRESAVDVDAESPSAVCQGCNSAPGGGCVCVGVGVVVVVGGALEEGNQRRTQ